LIIISVFNCIYLSGDAENLMEKDSEEKMREFWIDGNKERERKLEKD
jgi:hypothetical protein